MASESLRSKVYRQLEASAWPGRGLSPTTLFLAVLIVVTVLAAILETEPAVAQGRELLFENMEVVVGAIFSIEYLLRLWVAVENPRFAKYRYPRLRYAVTPIAIIDLVAVIPALFAFSGASSLVLRFFRVVRMIRLAKLGRTSKAFKLLREAFVQKRQEFALILGMLLVTILVAGSLLYWAEGGAQPDKFGSIPRAMWWAIVTLTTVGYGDSFPITPLGKFLAGAIAIMGVMLIALPTGLFAASFTEAMEKEREEDAAEEAEKAKS